MVDVQTQTLIVHFKIDDNLRFLSHKETSSMLQRALIRADVPLCYSQGFNPRPRLSLPLPRSVGVFSDDDILCAQVSYASIPDISVIADSIAAQLPKGCSIINLEVKDGRVKYHPEGACYEFQLSPDAVNDSFASSIRAIEDSCGGDKPLVVTRKSGDKRYRQVDVSNYIKGLVVEGQTVRVDCCVTQNGSVRIDELMDLMGVETADLAQAVRRKSVKWVCG